MQWIETKSAHSLKAFVAGANKAEESFFVVVPKLSCLSLLN
jgi:hypothetical protein